MVVASLGSTRNLGVPLPAADRTAGDRLDLGARRKGPHGPAAWPDVGLAAQAIAIASVHPYELSYFNALAGGPIGGRHDPLRFQPRLGPGAQAAGQAPARTPRAPRPDAFYFGDTDADRYGVAGQSYTVREANPNEHVPRTSPRDGLPGGLGLAPVGALVRAGFFRPLDGVEPVCYTADATIAIYRTADIPAAPGDPQSRTTSKDQHNPGVSSRSKVRPIGPADNRRSRQVIGRACSRDLAYSFDASAWSSRAKCLALAEDRVMYDAVNT